MNDKRRELLRQAESFLKKAALLIERAADEEQNSFENLPESIRDGERGEKMEAATELLEDAGHEVSVIVETLLEAAR